MSCCSTDQCLVVSTDGYDPVNGGDGNQENVVIEYADIINGGLNWVLGGGDGEEDEKVEGYVEIRDG